MRIIFFHHRFPTQFGNIVRHLASRPGIVVEGIACRPPEPKAPDIAGVRMHYLDVGGIKDSGGLFEALQSRFQKSELLSMALRHIAGQGARPDLVCAYADSNYAMFIKDALPDVPLLLYCEQYPGDLDTAYRFDPEFSAPAERFDLFRQHTQFSLVTRLLSLTRADRGVSPTAWQRASHPADVQPKIAVIHEGIDTKAVCPDPAASFTVPGQGIALTPVEETLTYVARSLEPTRGFMRFMRALPAVLSARPACRVLIAGQDAPTYDSPPSGAASYRESACRELAGQLDFSRVHFLGQLPYADYLRLLQISTAHVYLTRPFALSWSFMESLSAGCLVVGSRTAPVEEFITHEENGLLADYFSAADLSTQIVRALQERAAMLPLRQAARDTAVRRIDRDTQAVPAYVELLEEMMGRPLPSLLDGK